MKKTLLALTALLLVTVTVTGCAVFQFKRHQNVTDSAVLRAQNQRDTATRQAAAYRLNAQAAATENQQLGMQKQALCGQLTAARLKSVYCQ